MGRATHSRSLKIAAGAQMESLTEDALSPARGGQLSPQGPLTAALGRMQRISSAGDGRSRCAHQGLGHWKRATVGRFM